ncbi:MAG: hypothetical protein IT442_06880 [Phycisphaeraceae bacterium]|nr:hypothetical protein [Phycisphaeraceae bacterium]
MNKEVLLQVWPVLAILAYALVTCVLTTLAYMRRNQVDLHDRVRESLLLRQRYMATKEERQHHNDSIIVE